MLKRIAIVTSLAATIGIVAVPRAEAQTSFSLQIGRGYPPPVAVAPAAPPGYVWQPGHYVSTGYGYQWIPGAWVPALYGGEYGYQEYGYAEPYLNRPSRGAYFEWGRGNRDWDRGRGDRYGYRGGRERNERDEHERGRR